MPHARTSIKEYALKAYRGTHVCSVGSWVTYKPKSALKDVTKALGEDEKEISILTKNLPDEFDEVTIDSLNEIKKNLANPDATIRKDAHIDYNKYATFYEYWEANPEIVGIAFRLVGKIRSQGTHAGGVIISDRPIWNIIPVSLMKTGGWTSQWTEGKSTQLSKFGLVKYDILGLKTLFYVWQACNLIKKNRGIDVSLVDVDPSADPPRVGYEVDRNGTKRVILLNDPKALSMCNALRTDSVFQIETPIQKDIIRKGKVRNFFDLVVYNALGRPGPMDCCAIGSLINVDIGYIKIEDLDYHSHKILYMSNNGPKFTNQFRSFKSGKKKLYKIKLSNGKSLILSAEHKIKTLQCYKQVKDIKKGEIVYVKGKDSRVGKRKI